MREITKDYILNKGVENVRGGKVFEFLIDDRASLNENKDLHECIRIIVQSELCFNCFKKGHFADDCNANCDEDMKCLRLILKIILDENRCYNCFKVGHMAYDCKLII
jgi:hypothetical protein